MNSACNDYRLAQKQFRGFEPLDANFIYCPNQFFDVCLPNNSRSVIRLVAYMLRQTLGFRDANGDPIHEDISIPFQDFITGAGISRGSIRNAIDEAIAKNFIVCKQKACSKSKGKSSETGSYSLRWGTDEHYLKDSLNFDGFYTGRGCRSPIPNAFFDHVVQCETLAVIKVVGSVLRYTVGYETQFGRQEQAELSYSFIQNYTNLKDRRDVSKAIKRSLSEGYISCVSEGKFSSNSIARSTARYAIIWLQEDVNPTIGTKNPPAGERYKKPTNIGTKNPLENRYKKPTSKKKQLPKQKNKQQPVAANSKTEKLLQPWFDETTSRELLTVATVEQIQNQIDWLPHRNATGNPAGMLRKAIEQDWDEPASITTQKKQFVSEQLRSVQSLERQKQDEKASVEIKSRQNCRQERLDIWQSLSQQEWENARERAIENAPSEILRSRLAVQIYKTHTGSFSSNLSKPLFLNFFLLLYVTFCYRNGFDHFIEAPQP